MLTNARKPYPGDIATPHQIIGLADQYRRAADILLPTGKRRNPISRAPYRLSALHAIELYLNALLLDRGHSSAKLRALQHNLAARTDLALGAGLRLRRRTILHLKSISETREYLITRYGPEMTGTASQLNRLSATVREVSSKVSAMVAPLA